MCGIAHPNPIDRQRRIPLLRRIVHRRILIPIKPVRIPQPEPIKVVLRDAGHEKLNHVATVRDHDLGLAIARCDDAGEGCGDDRVYSACVAEDGLHEGGDRGGVAVVETCRHGEDLVGGGGGEGDA